MRPLRIGSILLVAAVVGAVLAVPALGQGGSTQSPLNVTVTTDRPNYDPGDLVTITVRVTQNGQPTSARIHRAVLTKYNQWGVGQQQSIARHFYQKSPGVFVAQAKAGKPGPRQLYVAVKTYQKRKCGRCVGIKAAGTGSFNVKPRRSKVRICKPDYVVKHVVNVPDWNVDPPVSWELSNRVLRNIRSRAGNVTFELAPAGTAVWSSIPPFGVVNDDLNNLKYSKLSFNSQTGTISGNLDFRDADRNDPNWHFYIRALNSQGDVVATVWMHIAFR